MKPLLAVLLLCLAFLTPPSVVADCGDLDDRCTYPDSGDGALQPGGPAECDLLDPGEREPAMVPLLEWYAKSVAQSACRAAAALEAQTLDTGGDAAHGAVVGVEEVASTEPPSGLEDAVVAATVSLLHDA